MITLIKSRRVIFEVIGVPIENQHNETGQQRTHRSTVHDDHCFALAGARCWGNAAHGAMEALHPLHDERRAKLQRLCCLRPQISAQQQLRRQAVDYLQLAGRHLGP